MPDPTAAYIGSSMVGMISSDNASDAAGDAAEGSLQAAQRSEDLNRERFALAQGYLDPYAGRANIAAQQLQAEMGLPQYGEQAGGSTVNEQWQDPNAGWQDPNMGPAEAGQEPYPAMPELTTSEHPAAKRLNEKKLAEWEQAKAAVDQRNRMGDAQQSPYASTGAGGGQEYSARDISQIPGYQAAMDESLAAAEQSAVSSGSTAYGGRRLEAAGEVGAGVQQSYYTNYMNMLQNLANPTVATNLAGMGVGQGQSIGQQNIAAQNMASNYRLQGTAAGNAAMADFAGGAANMYGAYMGQPGGQSQGGIEPETQGEFIRMGWI